MKKYLSLTTIGLCCWLLGCKGVPVEYTNTCAKANHGKLVEVVGFFNNTGSAMCSKSGNEPMRCPIAFKASLTSEEIPIRAYTDK